MQALSQSASAQATVQIEIDALVGHSRPPSRADLADNRLPYVCALAKDIHRWRADAVPDDESLCASEENWVLLGAGGGEPCDVQWEVRGELPEVDVLRPERFLENQEGDSGDEAVQSWDCDDRKADKLVFLSVLARLLWAFSIEADLEEPVSACE